MDIAYMGHGSNGPLVVNGHLLDLGTFEVMPLGPDRKGVNIGKGVRIPSCDGTVFGSWYTHEAPKIRRRRSSSKATMSRSTMGYGARPLRFPAPTGRTSTRWPGSSAPT